MQTLERFIVGMETKLLISKTEIVVVILPLLIKGCGNIRIEFVAHIDSKLTRYTIDVAHILLDGDL